MEQLEHPVGHNRKGIIVIVLVVLGIAAVGAGGYLVWAKKNDQGAAAAVPAADEVDPWCELRTAWARAVRPIDGDILLKSVKPEDRGERDLLQLKRNEISQKQARKVRELGITSDAIKAVEIALVKEGKTRANIAVEIDNIKAKLGAQSTSALNEQRERLNSYIKERIGRGRALADREVKAALAQLGAAACDGIYRGPMTDEGTSGNPYVTWDQLELERATALKAFDDRIKELEPREQFTNQVYHALVRSYRDTLVKCHKNTKRANPQMSDKLGLLVRLKPTGQVKSMGIDWAEVKDERFLDCLLQTAAKWRLPRPMEPGNRVVVVTLDLAAL